MDLTVSLEEKKSFLNHFIKTYKSSDIIWFFEDLIKHHEKLTQIRFVDKLLPRERGLYIVIDDYNNLFYFFKKGRVKLKNIHTAYHELNLDHTSAFYIAINFTNENLSQAWQQVVEMSDAYIENLRSETELFLNHLSQVNQINWLQTKIDEALEDRDKNAFEKYVALLNGLNELRRHNK